MEMEREMQKEIQRVSNLRTVREKVGLSRHELSLKTGISVRNIEAYEQGKIPLENAQYKTVKALAYALNVSTDKIV